MNFEFAFLAPCILFSAGLCGTLFWHDLFKKVICLGIFTSSIIIFYLIFGYYKFAGMPIFHGEILDVNQFVNPLPSVLMLTAIVVGISIQAIAFSLVIRIKKDYGTLNENEILDKLKKTD